MFSRKSWHAYFMDLAQAASTRATCNRKHVGCVLVVDKRVIATGYNGSIPGLPHCDDVGHDMHGQHCERCKHPLDGTEPRDHCDGVSGRVHMPTGGNCVRTVHAEINAVAQAAVSGVSTKHAIAYVNTYPCWHCFKVLASVGVTAIYYDQEYRNDERVEAAAKEAGIRLTRVED